MLNYSGLRKKTEIVKQGKRKEKEQKYQIKNIHSNTRALHIRESATITAPATASTTASATALATVSDTITAGK